VEDTRRASDRSMGIKADQTGPVNKHPWGRGEERGGLGKTTLGKDQILGGLLLERLPKRRGGQNKKREWRPPQKREDEDQDNDQGSGGEVLRQKRPSSR